MISAELSEGAVRPIIVRSDFNQSQWNRVIATITGINDGLVWSGFSNNRIHPVVPGIGLYKRMYPVVTGIGKKRLAQVLLMAWPYIRLKIITWYLLGACSRLKVFTKYFVNRPLKHWIFLYLSLKISKVPRRG